jgi:hypothetical protein
MPDSYVTVNGVSALNVAVVNAAAIQGVLKVGDACIETGDDATRPVRIGARVHAGIAQYTLEPDGDLAGLAVTGDRRLLTLPYGPPEDAGLSTPVAAPTNGDTTDFALVTARAAGIKIALWACEVLNLSAIANSVIIRSPALGDLGRFAIPASSGRFLGPWPTALRGAAAEAMNLRLTSAPTASTLYFTPFWFSTRE